MSTILLIGERVCLREIEVEDLPDIREMLEAPGQVRYIEFEATETSSVALLDWSLRSAKENPRTAYSLAMTLPSENKLIGVFSLVIRDVVQREGHLGIILNRRYQGKGLPFEAGKLMLRFGFEQLGLHRICAGCHAENRASSHLIEKAGFRREGYLRESRWEKGRWNDWLIYAMLDHEWRSQYDS